MDYVEELRQQQDRAWCKFAAAALQALLGNLGYVQASFETEGVAKHAAKYADAMLKEWEKR